MSDSISQSELSFKSEEFGQKNYETDSILTLQSMPNFCHLARNDKDSKNNFGFEIIHQFLRNFKNKFIHLDD